MRDKEVSKSALDSISGIGEVKKKALLKKFKSIKNIANASHEEIAEVKGINMELAERIKKELQCRNLKNF